MVCVGLANCKMIFCVLILVPIKADSFDDLTKY